MKNDRRSKFSNLSNFRLLLFNCLNWKIYCDDHSSLSSTTAVQKWIISYTSHHFNPHGRYELNKLTSLPMCGFIAQMVEQRTGNAEVTGSNPVKALIFFFQASSFQLLKLENLLRRSFFTFIYNRNSKMNYFIYFSPVLIRELKWPRWRLERKRHL